MKLNLQPNTYIFKKPKPTRIHCEDWPQKLGADAWQVKETN